MPTTCTTCGADLETDATVCGVCGEEVVAVASGGPAASETDGPGATPPPAGGPTPPPPSGGGPTPPPPGAGGGYGAGPGGPGYGAPGGYTPAPHPSGLPADVRNWGMGAHLSALVGAFVALAFLGPLLIWLLKREEHPFIDHHAKEALNFNLSILLYGVISAILTLVIVGIVLLLAVGIVWLVFTIIAAVKASNGEGYRYPLTIRFIS